MPAACPSLTTGLFSLSTCSSPWDVWSWSTAVLPGPPHDSQDLFHSAFIQGTSLSRWTEHRSGGCRKPVKPASDEKRSRQIELCRDCQLRVGGQRRQSLCVSSRGPLGSPVRDGL